ncbi:hypothetical protein PYW07_012665 [Mythimna separata]|uniref:C2H2-type domain-containing protein n=1 Tax=Mythimna separata TaxID=271217 RepID=A0AAD7Y8N2_MYTSE|nr:hypothetical protein PYW07_012665 [Mythimna separata]
MEETLNICQTCLSTDRQLVPVHKLRKLLHEIRFEELNESGGGVCWECMSILTKFHRFKNRAKIAKETLSQTMEHSSTKSLSTLTSKTNTLYDYQFTHTFDPLTNCNTKPKAEPDSIKQELIDHTNDYIDNTSDLDDETETLYIDTIEIKNDETLFKKQEENNEILDDNSDSNDDQKLHIDEKITEDSSNLQNIYTDMVESKYCDKLFKKQKGFPKKGPDNEEFIQNVYADTLDDKKPNKYKLKTNKSKRDLEKDVEGFHEKFVKVVLSQEEMIKVREEKRNQYNFKKIPYKCDTCVLGFTRKDTFSSHMIKKHDESIGDQICDVCSIRFRYKLALNNHRRKHYVVYRCRLCKYEIHEFMWAVNHCRTKHEDDTPDRIHCTQCGLVFKSPEDLEAHRQKDHSLFCKCGIKFKDKSNLRKHINRAHSGLRDFICDICKKTFNTKTRLESHMVTHNGHIAKKLAYCQLCRVQYKNIQVYRSHLKTSANHSEGHPCSECNKKFRSKGYLRQHYNFYHLRKSQYKCEVCNKIFISNWRLRNHKQQYHGLSRPRNHTCNICAKKFFRLATLRNHQLTHSDQRSFMCEDCGDTFKQSAALYTHTRLVHKGGGAKKKRDS